ncbi:MAG: MmcQ/YjbR family DNA-binding protein [Clostridia bacterium]|nr:MmcQ/YjbR family DNA-binding protein [Clostridia bacterium]
MTIEEKAFLRKRFLPEVLTAYGFLKTDAGFVYRTDFMDGDFTAVLTVTASGEATGTVIDNMNGEEYAPLRSERFNGAYVNAVRSAYEDVLAGIAAHCCRDTLFDTDQANRIADAIYETYGVRPDFPWGQNPHEHSGVFRHAEGGKWFALTMRIRRGLLTKEADETMTDVVNLKIDPQLGRPMRDGVYPAYHMNHKLWITVTLDDTLPDDEVMELVETSRRVTGGKAEQIVAFSRRIH